MDVQQARYWLLTSPHEEGAGPLPALSQEFYLEEDSKIKDDWSRILNGFKDQIYAYIVGLEDGNHLHVFLELRNPGNLLGVRWLCPDWDIKIVPEIDDQVEAAKRYCRKDGMWFSSYGDLIPSKYQDDPVWRGWQSEVVSALERQDDRQILIVFDSRGNHGKTFLALWHAARDRAVMIPSTMRSANDILRMVYARPSGCYFVDFPRGTTRELEKQLFIALECVKNGQSYDERYSFKDRLQDPPKICVFMNFLPTSALLSEDRWIVYDLGHERYTRLPKVKKDA